MLRSTVLAFAKQMNCYVDALDECINDELCDMVEFFEDLGTLAMLAKVGFRVCFATLPARHRSCVSELDLRTSARPRRGHRSLGGNQVEDRKQ